MSDPVTILGTIAVGYAVSYIAEKLTGSETIGMIAGLAAGGWAGNAIAGYQAASAAGTAATSAAKAGSALKAAGGMALPALGTTAPTAAGTFGSASQFAGMAGAAPAAASAAAPAIASSAAPAAASASSGSFLGGFSPDELLKVAAGGLSGMAEYRQKDEMIDVYKDRQELSEKEFDEEKKQYYAKGAYGVTNDGRVVPINAGQQLQEMNQRVGYTPYTSMGTMTNINTIQRPDSGYVSQFGRFSKDKQNA